MRYAMPIAEMVVDFLDQLKSRTKGTPRWTTVRTGDPATDLVKVDIMVQDQPGRRVLDDRPHRHGVQPGRVLVGKLPDLIPRQLFEVPIQAAIGSRVIAREKIRAIRKDVLAKCYGGDITRKRKLLEKQTEGKKRMKMVGRVEVPQEAFIAALSTGPGAGEVRQEVSLARPETGPGLVVAFLHLLTLPSHDKCMISPVDRGNPGGP